jgi:hypothetical protein
LRSPQDRRRPLAYCRAVGERDAPHPTRLSLAAFDRSIESNENGFSTNAHALLSRQKAAATSLY